MNATESWESFLAAKTKELNRYWLTRAEFEGIVDDLLEHPTSSLRGLQFALAFDDPFQPFEIGRAPDGDADQHTVPLIDNRGGRCRIRCWSKIPASQAVDIPFNQLADLLKAWWKPQLRTPSAGLPDLKRSKLAVQIAEATVTRSLEKEQSLAVISCDLDNFKAVNTKFTQSGGDRVIKHFGALVEPVVAPFGILLHCGGDELVILCPIGGAGAAIRAAYAVQRAVASYDFKISSLVLGMSAGMAATDAPHRHAGFQELYNEAEQVLKKCVKAEKKGRARFQPNQEMSPFADWSPAERTVFGKSLVFSAVRVAAPFGNAWLNALSAVVAESVSYGHLASATAAAQDFIIWMGVADGITPMPPGQPPKFVSMSVSVSPTATPLELAFAVVHGVIASPARAEAGVTLNLRYSPDGRAAGLYLPNGDVLWCSDPAAAECSERCQLPVVPAPAAEEHARAALGLPCAVLIKIGHSPLPVPAHLFSEVIVVDDRPTRGGCLPDFWEVTIARLVARVDSDPNIRAVFVVGDHKNGAETIFRLRRLDLWSQHAENMASRLSVAASTLLDAAKWLEGRIFFPQDYKELVRVLAEKLDTVPPFQAPRRVSSPPQPSLKRPLQLGSMALRPTDGFRAETVAEAFPVMLEIVRNADTALILDQAGQTLRELVDFKVHLSRPDRNMIPAYYRDQEDRMQQYFQSAFLNDTQFFGRALRAGGQLDAVLSHLAGIIKQDEGAFATRRAILVVPPEHTGKEEWSPLGLVSVRMIPRFSGQHCELSFSFTWRTVEALVGFPYSLYGSVCFAQKLTQLVSELLPKEMQGRVSMGFVSYLAHSLHMFMDDFGKAIVRRIVNDATG